MKNTMKLFAIMMVMVCMLVAGCQSNEEKYTLLKNDTIKMMDEIDNKKRQQDNKIRYMKFSEKAKAYAEIENPYMDKIKKNAKEMEELSKKEIKLTNDFRLFKEKTDWVISENETHNKGEI